MFDYDCLSDERLIDLLRGGEQAVESYLLEKYKSLVKIKARKLFLVGGDTEDLLQEGMLGLFKAVKSYKEGEGASFATYASLCISRQMYSAIESAARKKHSPLNESISFTELEASGEEAVGRIINENPLDLLIRNEEYERLLKEVNEILSPMEKKVFALYLQGKDYIMIAEELEKSPKSIDNALQRIRKKIIKKIT